MYRRSFDSLNSMYAPEECQEATDKLFPSPNAPSFLLPLQSVPTIHTHNHIHRTNLLASSLNQSYIKYQI